MNILNKIRYAGVTLGVSFCMMTSVADAQSHESELERLRRENAALKRQLMHQEAPVPQTPADKNMRVRNERVARALSRGGGIQAVVKESMFNPFKTVYVVLRFGGIEVRSEVQWEFALATAYSGFIDFGDGERVRIEYRKRLVTWTEEVDITVKFANGIEIKRHNREHWILPGRTVTEQTVSNHARVQPSQEMLYVLDRVIFENEKRIREIQQRKKQHRRDYD